MDSDTTTDLTTKFKREVMLIKGSTVLDLIEQRRRLISEGLHYPSHLMHETLGTFHDTYLKLLDYRIKEISQEVVSEYANITKD